MLLTPSQRVSRVHADLTDCSCSEKERCSYGNTREQCPSDAGDNDSAADADDGEHCARKYWINAHALSPNLGSRRRSEMLLVADLDGAVPLWISAETPGQQHCSCSSS